MAAASRRLRAVGILVITLTGLGLAVSVVLVVVTDAGTGSGTFRSEMLAQDVMIVALGLPGAWLLLRLPGHPAGWLMMSVAVALVLNSVGGAWTVFATADGRDLPFAAAGLVLVRLASWSEVGVPLLLLLFPDGRLPSPRWRPVLAATVVGAGLLGVVSLFVPLSYVFADASPGEVPQAFLDVPDLTGLTGVPADWWPFAVAGVTLLDAGLLLPALGSLVVRYRRADATETAQLRWLAVGGLAMLVAVVVSRLTPAMVGMPVSAAATLVLATTVMVAVLRYRLGDAALTLNRTVVYASLSALVTGLYAAVVGTVTLLVGGRTASWVAAAAVAVAFAPLRTRLQTWMDRRLRGERADPYGLVSGLARQLETSIDPQEIVRATVDSIAAAFRATWVRIELDGAPPVVVERGTPAAGTVMPLRAQDKRFGTLSLALPAGVRLSESDLALVADLVRHSFVVVQTLDAAHQLRQARARLVLAREDERRRLRRDLHDGLGPQLAGLTLKLDAVRNLMVRDPERAEALVVDAKRDVLDAVEDVRRVSHDLRPPALDESGLVGALRQLVSRFQDADVPDLDRVEPAPRLQVSLVAPPSVGELPAAVEVAAYRIVAEALTNVVRHSGARRCEVAVRLSEEQVLAIDVRDDGVGLPASRNGGLGLASMHERAAEVGGECDVQSAGVGGTLVTARLPMVTR